MTMSFWCDVLSGVVAELIAAAVIGIFIFYSKESIFSWLKSLFLGKVAITFPGGKNVIELSPNENNDYDFNLDQLVLSGDEKSISGKKKLCIYVPLKVSDKIVRFTGNAPVASDINIQGESYGRLEFEVTDDFLVPGTCVNTWTKSVNLRLEQYSGATSSFRLYYRLITNVGVFPKNISEVSLASLDEEYLTIILKPRNP